MHRFDEMPPVPLTLEGAAVLHQMARVRWPAWRALEAANRAEILAEAAEALQALEQNRTAAYELLGHKGDIMLVHFRAGFDELTEVQRTMAGLRLWDFLEQTTSYLSVVELGLYESTGKVYAALAEKGVAPHSEEWNDLSIEEERFSSASAKPCTRACSPKSLRQSSRVFIPWTGAGASRKTGIRFRSKTASS